MTQTTPLPPTSYAEMVNVMIGLSNSLINDNAGFQQEMCCIAAGLFAVAAAIAETKDVPRPS